MSRGFLVGAERSGSTLLRLMLAHHPKLSWIPEFTFALDNFPDRAADARQAAAALSHGIDSANFLAALGVHVDARLPYGEMLDHLLQQVQNEQGTRLVGATIHRHFDRLVRVWPEARFIHLIRDGRDVARSRIGMGWAGNVWTSAPVWTATERSWDEARRTLPKAQVLDVRFEDLVAKPESELDRICDFLGVAYDSAMLSYSNTANYDRPRPELAHQWKRRLSRRDVRRAEAVQAQMLIDRGYELSGEPPLRVGVLERLVLRSQCKLARTLHCVRLLGPALYVADLVQRRVPLPSMLQQRIIERRYSAVRQFVK